MCHGVQNKLKSLAIEGVLENTPVQLCMDIPRNHLVNHIVHVCLRLVSPIAVPLQFQIYVKNNKKQKT